MLYFSNIQNANVIWTITSRTGIKSPDGSSLQGPVIDLGESEWDRQGRERRHSECTRLVLVWLTPKSICLCFILASSSALALLRQQNRNLAMTNPPPEPSVPDSYHVIITGRRGIPYCIVCEWRESPNTLISHRDKTNNALVYWVRPVWTHFI